MSAASSVASGNSDGVAASQADRGGGARPLQVIARRADSAGPSQLTQQFTGLVQAPRTSRLAAKTLGRVEKVFVDIGDQVQAGQELVELDSATLLAERRVLVADLAAAKAALAELTNGPRIQDIAQAAALVDRFAADLALSEINLGRVAELRKSGAVSQQTFDETRYRSAALQAQLDSAQQALSRLQEGTRPEQLNAQTAMVEKLNATLAQVDVRLDEQKILAPYAGVIQSRAIDEGVIVSPGQALVEIVEAGALEIQVGLPPELARGLSNSNLRVSLGNQPLAAQIQRIAPSINPTTRSRDVILQINSASSQIVAIGEAVSVAIDTPVVRSSDSNGAASFWVPAEALTSAARGLWAVYIAEPVLRTTASDTTNAPDTADATDAAAAHDTSDASNLHTVQRRQVELLRSQGNWSEIRGPIAAEELIICEGVHRISPGQRVVLSQE